MHSVTLHISINMTKHARHSLIPDVDNMVILMKFSSEFAEVIDYFWTFSHSRGTNIVVIGKFIDERFVRW